MEKRKKPRSVFLVSSCIFSGRGAYHPSLVYTKDDIKNVVEYARDRGIRIIPEFDVPGHSRSWGKSFHIILTKCYKNERFVGFGPMNPISKYTYKLLRELFREVQAWFPDKYIHIGGDEVDFKCWQSNPELQTYTRRYGKNIYQMYNVFINKVMALLGNKSIPIVWQEVFDNNVPISHETLVQVWKYRWNEEMVDILTSGHRLVFSSTWYLDYLNKGWEYFYRYDPRQVAFEMLNSDATLHNIVGGEACMWGEMTDDANMMSRTWPRTSAVAERLWSGLDYKAEYFNPVTDEVRSRLEEQTCRMRRRGIHAEPPNGPGFCIGAI